MHKQITGLYLNQPLPKKSEMASNGSNGDNNDTDGRYHMIFLNTTHLSTHLRGNQPSQDKVHIYMLWNIAEITTSFHITLFVYRGVACERKLIEK